MSKAPSQGSASPIAAGRCLPPVDDHARRPWRRRARQHRDQMRVADPAARDGGAGHGAGSRGLIVRRRRRRGAHGSITVRVRPCPQAEARRRGSRAVSRENGISPVPVPDVVPVEADAPRPWIERAGPGESRMTARCVESLRSRIRFGPSSVNSSTAVSAWGIPLRSNSTVTGNGQRWVSVPDEWGERPGSERRCGRRRRGRAASSSHCATLHAVRLADSFAQASSRIPSA